MSESLNEELEAEEEFLGEEAYADDAPGRVSPSYDDLVEEPDIILQAEGKLKGMKKWLVFRSSTIAGPCRLMAYKNRQEVAKSKAGKVVFTAREIENVETVGDGVNVKLLDKKSPMTIKFDNPDEWEGILACQCDRNLEFDVFKQVEANLLENPMCEVHGTVQLQVGEESVSVWQDRELVLHWPLTRILLFGHFSGESFQLECDECCVSHAGLFEFETTQCVKPWADLHEVYQDWDFTRFETPAEREEREKKEEKETDSTEDAEEESEEAEDDESEESEGSEETEDS